MCPALLSSVMFGDERLLQEFVRSSCNKYLKSSMAAEQRYPIERGLGMSPKSSQKKIYWYATNDEYKDYEANVIRCVRNGDDINITFSSIEEGA